VSVIENSLTLSADRMELTISQPDGHVATLRSARRHGFTDDDLDKARHYLLNPHLMAGQVDRARRFQICGRTVYVHVNTGPPTWWLPRVRVRRREVMLGWFRALIALSWAAVPAMEGKP
jgi:hypothetical protein